MEIKRATFKCSSQQLSQIPRDTLPDIAFIGRSNVGKSSLINLLTGHGSLAKVSGTPGKTRLINHFLIDDRWYLVDLPGYGYARVSKSERGEFSKLITDYVFRSEKMHFLFVLVDSRLEPLTEWEELPPLFFASSAKRTGREEILAFIDKCLKDS